MATNLSTFQASPGAITRRVAFADIDRLVQRTRASFAGEEGAGGADGGGSSFSKSSPPVGVLLESAAVASGARVLKERVRMLVEKVRTVSELLQAHVGLQANSAQQPQKALRDLVLQRQAEYDKNIAKSQALERSRLAKGSVSDTVAATAPSTAAHASGSHPPGKMLPSPKSAGGGPLVPVTMAAAASAQWPALLEVPGQWPGQTPDLGCEPSRPKYIKATKFREFLCEAPTSQGAAPALAHARRMHFRR